MHLLLLLLGSSLLASAKTVFDNDTCKETHVTLHNGVRMPRVGFGLAGLKGKDARNSIKLHLEAGFRMFDTAEATEWYDDVAAAQELAANKAVKREDIFIVEKVHPKNLGEKQTYEAVMKMLARFGTPYLDAVLLHYMRCGDHIADCKGKENDDWKGAYRALEKLYEEKKVRAIGVSNVIGKDDISALYEWAKIKPHILQNWMDPYRQNRDEYDWGLSEGAVTMAYSSLGGQWEHYEEVERNLVRESPWIGKLAENKTAEKGFLVSRSALLFSWLLNIPGVVIIPRSNNPEHIKENAKLLNPSYVDGILTQQDWEHFEKLDDRFDLMPADYCKKMDQDEKCVPENPDVDGCIATCYEIEW